VRQHAKDLAAFIESQGGPIFLVGWSYGAQVAFEMARTRPELVKRLVLAEAPLYSLLPAAVGDALVSARGQETARYFERGDMDGGLNYAIDAINCPGVWGWMDEARRQGICISFGQCMRR
jgi:pimeloyl-ACP methyl ester carboxylesterase